MNAKSFEISKQLVWKAWILVRSNHGAGGVDEQNIEGFEADLKNNLYRIWNRMTSGCYFPPDVRGVEIPKRNGGTRLLGIPTISDRVAQAAVKLHIEERLEKVFLPDAYGYRPGRSAHDAVGITRQRCWRWKWLLEFDIRAMFDRIPHDLVMKAVEKHIPEKWCRLYLSRWLQAGIQLPSGVRLEKKSGTPQGGVISPLLANLFMHYAFDVWMKRSFPDLPWCRYADDGVIHCRSKAQAQHLQKVLAERFAECGIELHSEKTHIVYTGTNSVMRQENRNRFDFLGFEFQVRGSKCSASGRIFNNFLPAVSNAALKQMKYKIKWEWNLRRRSGFTLEQIAEFYNPVIRGWFNYYGKFYASRMERLARYINDQLVRWARRRFRRKNRERVSLHDWLCSEFSRRPRLFAHWVCFKIY